MITINFSIAIAIFLSILLILVIGRWIMYNKREEENFKKSEYVVQCPYCSYIFYDFQKKDIEACPRCKSYIEKDDK